MKLSTLLFTLLISSVSILVNAQNVNKSTNKINAGNLPDDFPPLTINIVNNPAKGQILFAPNVPANGKYGYYLIILDENGNVYKYKKVPNRIGDFKIQPNGLITFGLRVEQGGVGQQGVYYIMDSTLTVIDSVKAVGTDSIGNKYITDIHEFLILPNGNYLFTIKYPTTMDMSQYGGKDSATVVHGILQELDVNKNVIWQWRSWDHIPIEDTYNPLTGKLVRLNHFNTVGITNDGNILMGNRTNAEALKIDIKTGEIIWRFGGKDNQFTFTGDNDANSPNYFSAHDIRMLPNGNITLFDNGNNHSPWFSRAVEYKVDQVNKTATQVWEYRHQPNDIAARITGSVERLPNGNTFIGWGGKSQDSTSADITEVAPDGTKTFELTFPPKVLSYRALKYPWNINRPSASIVKNNIVSGSDYAFNNSSDATGVTAHINSFSGPELNKFSLKRYNLAPVFPEFTTTPLKVYRYRLYFSSLSINSINANLEFKLSSFPQITDPSKIKIYARANEGKGLFTPLTTIYDPVNSKLIVNNAGFGEYIFANDNNIVTGIESVRTLPKDFLLSQNYPNPFNPSTVISYSIPSVGASRDVSVLIRVFDVLGREVATLVNKEQPAGNYKVTFNATQLSSGIYFYRISATGEAGSFIQTKKMILLK